MDDLKQQWAVTLEEKHDPITVIGGQRGSGKIFFLENALRFLEEQLKHEKIETERWKSAALYYADKLGSAQKLEVVRCKDCEHWMPGDSMMGDSVDDMQRVGGCPYVRFRRLENDFCSYGERKDND